jgi:hypothetical protein
MVEIDYVTSKKITGSPTPHAVDTFQIHGRPDGVILKLRYRPVKPGLRVIYRMKKKGEMTLQDQYYTADLEKGRVTVNWTFDLDCTFIVEYQYDPGT